MDRSRITWGVKVALVALALKWLWLAVLILGVNLLFGVNASVEQAELPAWGLAILTLGNLMVFGLF
jgi:uncharacterized membrane-anchored protein